MVKADNFAASKSIGWENKENLLKSANFAGWRNLARGSLTAGEKSPCFLVFFGIFARNAFFGISLFRPGRFVALANYFNSQKADFAQSFYAT